MRRRRDFLATIGATATALTAGCLQGRSNGTGYKPVRVMRMKLVNMDRSPADMEIELIRDSESVFREVFTLAGKDQDGLGGKVISPEPGTEPGRYECLVEADIGESVLEASFESDQMKYSASDPCIEVNPIIESSGYSREPGPSLSIGVGQINNRYDRPPCG